MTSFLLAPFSRGIVWFFLFIFVFEMALALWTGKKCLRPQYVANRSAVVLASILGWWMGRLVIHDNYPASQITDWFYSDDSE